MSLSSYVVTVAATVTATAAVSAAGYARRASKRSARALRHLEGESEDDPGVLEMVHEHRDALLHADLYPPLATDGGEESGR